LSWKSILSLELGGYSRKFKKHTLVISNLSPVLRKYIHPQRWGRIFIPGEAYLSLELRRTIFIPGVEKRIFLPGVEKSVFLPGVDRSIFIPGIEKKHIYPWS
jgi:hypothetical protein